MGLSIRLQSLRNKYQNERSIWDIGCDHGLLGLSFACEPSVEAIHLVDPSSAVINQLQKTIDSYITKTRIFIHHSHGQKVELGEGDHLIFIAGMGGKEIREILESLKPQLSPPSRIIISPHRNILELRKFLNSSRYRLESESVLLDGEQFYQIIALSLDASLPEVGLYGSSLWSGEWGKAYREHQLRFFGAHRDELSRMYCNFLETLNP